MSVTLRRSARFHRDHARATTKLCDGSARLRYAAKRGICRDILSLSSRPYNIKLASNVRIGRRTLVLRRLAPISCVLSVCKISSCK